MEKVPVEKFKEIFLKAAGEMVKTIQASDNMRKNRDVRQAAPILKLIDSSSSELVPQSVGYTFKTAVTLSLPLDITIQPDVNVAISELQGVFTRQGISIGLCAECHDYKNTAPVRPKKTFDVQTFKQALRTNDTEGWSESDFTLANKVVQEYRDKKSEFNSFDFKRHNAAVKDLSRAELLQDLGKSGTTFPKADLIIIERGLKNFYTLGGNSVVREDDLLPPETFSIRQRSLLIAAYVFFCAIAGRQLDDARVLVFFGEEHRDILDFFEYFALYSEAHRWIRKLGRNYCLIPSHVNN